MLRGTVHQTGLERGKKEDPAVVIVSGGGKEGCVDDGFRLLGIPGGVGEGAFELMALRGWGSEHPGRVQPWVEGTRAVYFLKSVVLALMGCLVGGVS